MQKKKKKWTLWINIKFTVLRILLLAVVLQKVAAPFYSVTLRLL
jgi:hypothetical protein